MARVSRCWWDYYCSMLLSLRPTARFLTGQTTIPTRSIFFASPALRRNYSIDPDGRFVTNGKIEVNPFSSANASSTTVDAEEEVKRHRDERREIDEERIAKEVSETIARESEWEEVLFSLSISDYPHHNYLYSTSCISKVIKSKSFTDNPQNQQDLTLRYITWLSKLECFDPNQSNLTSLFRASLDVGAWKASMFAIRLMKFQIDASFIDSFVLLLCQNSALDEVLEVVSSVNLHSISTWNTAIRQSLVAERTDLVWRFYEIMIGSGVSGNVFVFDCLIEAFCKENRLAEALVFVRQICRSGFVPNVISFNKLVDGYCKVGYFGDVSTVLHLMIAVSRPPNEDTYTSIIRELCNRHRVDEAVLIFQGLKRRGYTINVAMYGIVILGLCKEVKLADARKLFDEMENSGIKLNHHTYNAIIYGYCRIGNLVEAERLYSEMIGKDIEANSVTYNILLIGFCALGWTRQAVKLFDEMPKKGIDRTVQTFNILIRGFCDKRNTREGWDYFRQLVNSSGLEPNEASYIHLIKALCLERNMNGATELFTDMENRGLIPSTNRYYDCLINGYCKVGKVDEGMAWLWKVMNTSNLEPSKFAFNALIEGLTVAGRIDDAFLVLDVMAKFGHFLKKRQTKALIRTLCGVDCSSRVETRLEEILTAS
ncbi:hypothetical protein ZOSMA_79G00710 [Zostera marina]|uniref:PROP1-like PPR domain-containing protein n=1 Tax=Zostera marina TaxID=29655 RepID=A0A0K9NNP3_ZOSMR|nr:hypothetical protein ZOSMA_79G00710 [Zostera marina]